MKTNKLENFILQNQEQFNDLEPSDALWDRIQRDRMMQKPNQALRIKMNPMKWISAAAAVLLISCSLYFLWQHSGKNDKLNGNSLASQTHRDTDYYRSPVEKQIIPITIDSHSIATDVQVAPVQGSTQKEPVVTESVESLDNEALFHYTRLIEVKQKQIGILKKDEPLLFKQFSGDFEALENSFVKLKSAAKVSVNQEQVLQAMIQNLQMQTELLNRQLEIIKNIKRKKQQHYESIYNSSI